MSVELISSDDKEWAAIFDQVLFPLVLRLLKPETYHSDPFGMSETRVQAATLICKIFLRYLDQRPDQNAMLDLWLKILDVLDRMMNSGQGDSLVSHSLTIRERDLGANFTLQEEAIPESLKNILLVMADGGHLVPPAQDPSKEQIWTETKKRLERFLPALFVEIFPEAAAEEQPAPVSDESSPAATEKAADEQNTGDGDDGSAQPNVQEQDQGEGENKAEDENTEEKDDA